jgi:hypothetical protein
MQMERLQELARGITGRDVEIVVGDKACTDGDIIMITNPSKLYPDLPVERQDLLALTDTAHEATHIELWRREGKKRGRKPLTAKEFNELFALPLSPDSESDEYVKKLLNLVEDSLVDATAATFVGQAAMDTTNQFLVWNRQGATRKPIAILETEGQLGKCAAFIEAVFQFSVYGRLIESFCSKEVEAAAKAAAKTMTHFSRGAVSRTQAMKSVLATMQAYCPSPWRTPPDYKGPREHTQMPLPGSQDGNEGKTPLPSGKDGKEGNRPPPPPTKEGGSGHGDGTGEGTREHKVGSSDRQGRFDDPRLDALLDMLERVMKERSDRSGRGRPHWRTWSPGDVLTDPGELERYEADAAMGVDPLRSRCVYQRDRENHLLAAFIDSSGSVGDDLFVKLYRVLAALADRVAQTRQIKFGVGQFSGGASWVLHPTDDPKAIADLAGEKPKRLYSGGTRVREIFEILNGDFSGYPSADLVVLTDGYIEKGAELAKALEEACQRTGCRIKLHIVVFKQLGSTQYARQAKELLPQQIRVWNLGGEGLESV